MPPTIPDVLPAEEEPELAPVRNDFGAEEIRERAGISGYKPTRERSMTPNERDNFKDLIRSAQESRMPEEQRRSHFAENPRSQNSHSPLRLGNRSRSRSKNDYRSHDRDDPVNQTMPPSLQRPEPVMLGSEE